MGSELSGQAAEDAWRISHVSPWAPAKTSQQTALSLGSSEEGGAGNSSVEKRAAYRNFRESNLTADASTAQRALWGILQHPRHWEYTLLKYGLGRRPSYCNINLQNPP